MTLTDLIFRNNKDSKRVCIIQGSEEYTYQDLFRRVASVRDYLESSLERGDRVGILAENGIDFISAYLACFSSGNVAVPLNTVNYSTEMDYVIRDCQIKAVLASGRFFSKIDPDVPKESIPEISENSREKEYIPSKTKPEELAVLLYTSGSTRKPIAVMVKHGNLLANTNSILEYLKLQEEDRTMVVLPFFYCYGASLLHTALASGGSALRSHSRSTTGVPLLTSTGTTSRTLM